MYTHCACITTLDKSQFKMANYMLIGNSLNCAAYTTFLSIKIEAGLMNELLTK